MGTLILIRHGQSQWNLENRFTGWTDVPLTERGEKDARVTGAFLRKRNVRFDRAFTSRLIRATRTLDVILDALDQKTLPVIYDTALNERHYGDLQGLNKAEMTQKYGEKQVQTWRRVWEGRPPNGESHEDCERRVRPFFLQYILPFVSKGETVLVAAHGNSQRPIMKYLENLAPDATAALEIGLCVPYVYTIEADRMVKKEVWDIPGIVTKGASLTETQVPEGRV